MNRYTVVVIFIVLVMAGVIAKAGFIIFKEGDDWRRLVKTLRREDLSIPAKRGDILASDGRLISSSLPNYQLIIDTRVGGFRDSLLRKDIDSLSLLLSKKLGDRSPSGYKQYLTALYKGKVSNRRNVPLSTKRISHVDLKEIKRYPFFRLGSMKTGLIADKRMQRVKPFGSLASRTIGDIYPDMAMGGKNGLELAYDSLLKGVAGVYTRRKVGNKWTEIPDLEPIDGYNIRTTIDIELQDIAEQSLRSKLIEIDAQSGTVVLMEAKSGEIKAMSNLARSATGVYTESVNHAVMDELEPGSTFKIASLIAALESGMVEPTDSFDCMGGTWKIGPRYPNIIDHDRHKGGSGWLTVEEIIWNSSNIGTAKFVLKAFGDHPEKFVDALYAMKLNEPMALEIPGAGRPKIKHPIHNAKAWGRTSMPWMSFGYELQIPPIYTLAFYNAIANDGKMVRPMLVKDISNDGQVVKSMQTETITPSICSSSTLKKVRKILEGVITDGTGKAVQSDVVTIAGKTGTAQISQGKSGYQAGGKSHQVSFCGYFPADDPQYTAIVVIRKPQIGYASGGTMSGGVFKSIAEQMTAMVQSREAEKEETGNWAKLPTVKGGSYERLEKAMGKLAVDFKDNDVNSKWVKGKADDKQILLSDVPVEQNRMPAVIGMGARDAVFLLEKIGYKVTLSGRGRVIRQSITPGSNISSEKSVHLLLN